MDDTEKANGEISNVSLTAYIGDGAWEHAGSLNHRDLCNPSPSSAGCSPLHWLSAVRQPFPRSGRRWKACTEQPAVTVGSCLRSKQWLDCPWHRG